MLIEITYFKEGAVVSGFHNEPKREFVAVSEISRVSNPITEDGKTYGWVMLKGTDCRYFVSLVELYRITQMLGVQHPCTVIDYKGYILSRVIDGLEWEVRDCNLMLLAGGGGLKEAKFWVDEHLADLSQC